MDNDFSAYPTGDSHPSTAGHQKASGEFVQLLNIFYHRWAATASPTSTSTPSPTLAPTPTPAGTGVPQADGFVYLPLLAKGGPAPTPASTPTPAVPSHLVQPTDLVYQGAFRLPGSDTPPQTFACGGNAMTFNPDGDPASPDPYPGSLFVMGHYRMVYGDLPDGNQVAEIGIPVPAIAENPADLPQATFIQRFHDVAAGYFNQLEEIPKIGMQYLNHPATGQKIHTDQIVRCLNGHQHPDEKVAHRSQPLRAHRPRCFRERKATVPSTGTATSTQAAPIIPVLMRP